MTDHEAAIREQRRLFAEASHEVRISWGDSMYRAEARADASFDTLVGAILIHDPRVVALRDGVAAMFDLTGCDCDGSYYGDEQWPAPHHASDCPVFERWLPFEDALRAALSEMPQEK